MSGLWIRDLDAPAPLRELFQLDLSGGEMAFTYLGWAGIVLRTREHAVALDLCQKNITRAEIKQIAELNVQCYGHTHWDHWHPPHAKALLKQTAAPILVEPAVVEERGSIPEKDLRAVTPGSPVEIGDVTVTGAVGVHPRPITMFHIEMPKLRLFHGGDSGHVPVTHLPADIAFVPTGVPSPSCSPESAVAMARDVGASIVVAVHGSDENMDDFRTLAASELPGVELVIPHPCQLVTLSLPGRA